MPEYYGGAPNAFAGGMEYGAERRKRIKQENALNALIEQYGPQAGDAATAALMQRTQQSGELHPYDVQEAQRVDAARAAEVASGGARMGDPAVHARDVATEDRDRAAQLDAGRRAVAVLKYAKVNGKDIGAAFDVAQQGLTAIGISPDKFAEVRNEVVTNPDSIDELEQLMLGMQDPNVRGSMSAPRRVFNRETKQFEMIQQQPDGSWTVMPGLTASEDVLGAERNATSRGNLEQRSRALTIKEREDAGFKAPPGMQLEYDDNGRIIAAAIPGTEQETKLDEARVDLETKDRKFLQVAGVFNASKEIVDLNVARALPYFKGARAGVVMQSLRLGMKLLPGTDAGNADDAIKEIKAKISIDALQQMRQNSPTGGAMGAISDRDITILESALGRLETERVPKRMVEDLNFITKEYNRIVGLAQQDATRANARLKRREQRPQLRFAPGTATGLSAEEQAELDKWDPPR